MNRLSWAALSLVFVTLFELGRWSPLGIGMIVLGSLQLYYEWGRYSETSQARNLMTARRPGYQKPLPAKAKKGGFSEFAHALMIVFLFIPFLIFALGWVGCFLGGIR